MRKIYRYQVPVDGQSHRFDLRGKILHVGSRTYNAVEFWAWHDDTCPTQTREFTVIGTGQSMDFSGWHVHVGTAPTPDGDLVWHLIERNRAASALNDAADGTTPTGRPR